MSDSSRPDSAEESQDNLERDAEDASSLAGGELAAEGALGETGGVEGRSALVTTAWAAPGTLWLFFFLLAPVVTILLVSFWTPTISGFETDWTLENYRKLIDNSVYWNQIKTTVFVSLIVTGSTLVFGYPIAYFLALKVNSLRNQIILFIVVLAPFWTSGVIRAVAWIPMMGRQGAVNRTLQALGLIDKPLDILLFTKFAVALAMVQLFILFMVAPLFFVLAQIDRSSLEASRDLGANWLKTFREVILPQSMAGIVIGSIFVFVLTMGEQATHFLIGGGQLSSVGVIVRQNVNAIQFPQAATSAVFLVVVMMVGVFILTRVSNLREEL